MRISTIIPAYNRADLIGETLRTVLEQTRPPHEVIVVDDGSTDATVDVVASFGKAVTLLRQANAGAGPARNAGFARSSGEIVSFMDSDDLCSLNFYEAGARRIEAGADMTYSPWLKTRIDGRRLRPEPVVLQQGALPAGLPIDVRALLVEWYPVLQPCLFRRDLVERAGPYRTDLKPTEDTELFYRLTAAARDVVHVPEPIILYRVHPENQVSEQDPARRLIDRANLWSILQQHLDGRTDIGWRERRTFRIKKYYVALEAMEHDADKAASLMRDVRWHERSAYQLRHLRNRVWARLGKASSGASYNMSMAVAPLRDDQLELIAAMGYELTDATLDAAASPAARRSSNVAA